jgi:hypothetical protein
VLAPAAIIRRIGRIGADATAAGRTATERRAREDAMSGNCSEATP